MSHIEKFWRDATAADVVDVMNGKEVEARFRDGATESWIEGLRLGGWAKDNRYPWTDESGSGWTQCQVYAPPQWFLDKPDPGEEYRLLEKFPDEALQRDDEAFDLRGDGKWEPSFNVETGYGQNESTWYRRRIEQPKPEPKFKVGQRVKIIGPKRSEKVRYNWEHGMDNQVGKTGVVTGSHDGSFGRLYQLSGIVEWNFQEDYLEPVEPKHYVLQVGDTISTPSGRQAIVTELGIEVS